MSPDARRAPHEFPTSALASAVPANFGEHNSGTIQYYSMKFSGFHVKIPKMSGCHFHWNRRSLRVLLSKRCTGTFRWLLYILYYPSSVEYGMRMETHSPAYTAKSASTMASSSTVHAPTHSCAHFAFYTTDGVLDMSWTRKCPPSTDHCIGDHTRMVHR